MKDNIISQEYSSQIRPLEIIINASQLNNDVKVYVSAKNNSKETIIIPKKNIPFNGALSNPIFSIISECIRLDYVGQIVNFGSVYQYPEDYVTIEPDHQYHASINLGRYYHFLPGVHTYAVFIPMVPFLFKKSIKDDESSVRSNTIHLTVKGP